MSDLFAKAHLASFAGQDQPTALYRGDTHGMPWDKFNAGGEDKGDPPWAWGLGGIIDHACHDRNMLLQPGWIFFNYFLWPSGSFEGCVDSSNTYRSQMNTCTAPVPCPSPLTRQW